MFFFLGLPRRAPGAAAVRLTVTVRPPPAGNKCRGPRASENFPAVPGYVVRTPRAAGRSLPRAANTKGFSMIDSRAPATM